MQKRKKIFWLLMSSAVLLVTGYALMHNKLGFCYENHVTNTFDASCIDKDWNIGAPLFYGMSSLALVFLALFIFPSAWPAWKKFAKWYIPIAALVFIFYQGPGAMDLFSPYPEQVYKWIGIIYVAVSAVIILFASAKNRK